MGNLGIETKIVPVSDGQADASMNVRWSNWARCESSFGMALAPDSPGVLALAEEVLQSNGKRILALYHVEEAAALSRAVSALFAAGSPHRERLEQGRSFARYAVVAEASARRAVSEALGAWMATQSQAASGIAQPVAVAEPNCDCDPADCTHSPAHPRRESSRGDLAERRPKPVFPAGF